MSYKNFPSLKTDYSATLNRVKESKDDFTSLLRKASEKLSQQNNFKFNQIPGSVINSSKWTSFAKDIQFYIEDLNKNLLILDNAVTTFSVESFNFLKDLEKTTIEMDSSLIEKEIKLNESLTAIHFNSFSREVDLGLDFLDSKWKNYSEKQKAQTITNVGLTLPIDQETDVFISDIKLIGEESDVGDSSKVLFSSSPRNLLFKDKQFKHVILRKDFDSSGIYFKQNASEISLNIELAFPQKVNKLELSAVGATELIVKQFSYINLSDEKVNFENYTTSSSALININFEPVIAKSFNIVLSQFAPIDNSIYHVKDQKIHELNKLLEGVGLDIKFDSNEEYINGRVYDFSLSNLKLSLVSYLNKGIFISKDIEVIDPQAFSFVSQEENIKINSIENSGKITNLPFDLPFSEKYLSLELYNNNEALIFSSEEIPVLTKDEYQVQRLPINNKHSKVNYYPDLLHSTDYRIVDKVEVNDTSSIIITFKSNHNLEGINKITFICSEEKILNGEISCTVVNEKQVKASVFQAPNDFILNINYAPKIYALLNTSQMPFDIYIQDELLALKKDYLISLDGGKSFIDYIPYSDYIKRTNAYAGEFLIKFKNPRLDKNYYISYKHKSNQYVTKDQKVILKNNLLLLDSSLHKSKGVFRVTCLLDNITNNKYLSPILKYYTVKVY